MSFSINTIFFIITVILTWIFFFFGRYTNGYVPCFHVFACGLDTVIDNVTEQLSQDFNKHVLICNYDVDIITSRDVVSLCCWLEFCRLIIFRSPLAGLRQDDAVGFVRGTWRVTSKCWQRCSEATALKPRTKHCNNHCLSPPTAHRGGRDE